MKNFIKETTLLWLPFLGMCLAEMLCTLMGVGI